MELTDQRDIAAPPEDVWSALVSAEVLKHCIPGCQEMKGSPEEGYEAVVVQKVGPVKATFRGAVTLTNVVPGQSCTISGEGKGGAAGFAKGAADVVLTPTGEGTRLSYDVKAKVGGKLAQVGNRVIDGFAKKMADQFFDNFKSMVEGDAADAAQVVDASGDAVAAAPPPTGSGSRPAPGGHGAPGADAAGEPTSPPSSPDEPQVGEKKKSWFKRLMG